MFSGVLANSFSLSFHSLVQPQNQIFLGLPRMEALVRIGNIPLVESSVKTAEHVYFGLKVRDAHYFDHLPYHSMPFLPFDSIPFRNVMVGYAGV